MERVIFILKVDGESEITINDFNSHDYFIRQYFEDGETCRINELDLFFGGVGEAEVSLKVIVLAILMCFLFMGNLRNYRINNAIIECWKAKLIYK